MISLPSPLQIPQGNGQPDKENACKKSKDSNFFQLCSGDITKNTTNNNDILKRVSKKITEGMTAPSPKKKKKPEADTVLFHDQEGQKSLQRSRIRGVTDLGKNQAKPLDIPKKMAISPQGKEIQSLVQEAPKSAASKVFIPALTQGPENVKSEGQNFLHLKDQHILPDEILIETSEFAEDGGARGKESIWQNHGASPQISKSLGISEGVSERFTENTDFFNPGMTENPAIHQKTPGTLEAAETKLFRDPLEQPSYKTMEISLPSPQRPGTLKLELSPAHLGRVDVSVTIGFDGRIDAVVAAEKAETFHLLSQDSRELQRVIADSFGQELEGFELSMSMQQQEKEESQDFYEPETTLLSLNENPTNTEPEAVLSSEHTRKRPDPQRVWDTWV